MEHETGPGTDVWFREVQSFRESRLGFALLFFLFVTLILVFVLWSSQNGTHGTVGSPNQRFGSGICVFAGSLLIALIGLLWSSKLITKVSRGGLFIRYVPFHVREQRIDLTNLISFSARTYRPLVEYGGWGIRYSSQGKAYNVRGNRGVQLGFANNEPLLVGSQRADELVAAIRRLMNTNA